MNDRTVIGPLTVGTRVLISTSLGKARQLFTVRATDGRYSILTHQHNAFRPKGEPAYAILDHQERICGAADVIVRGFDLYMGDEACQELLELVQQGRAAGGVGISHRRRATDVQVVEVRND